MRSKIYLNEAVLNKQHTFGESNKYYPAKVFDGRGRVRKALFTKSQLEVAFDRAEKNLEDFPKQNWFQLFLDGDW